MDVRLPDGTIIRNVPEGTTKAQLTEKLRANGYNIPDESAKPLPANAGVANLIANVAGMPMETVKSAANLGIAGYGAAKGALGGKDLPELIQSVPGDVANVKSMLRQTGAPGLSPDNPAPDSKLGTLAYDLASRGGMIPGAALPAAASIVAEKIGGPEWAGVGALTPQAVIQGYNAARAPTLARREAQNAVKDATLSEARKEGYVVPPSSADGGFISKRLESVAGKAALGQEAAVKNQQITNEIARRELGLPKDAAISQSALEAHRNKLAAPYREVAGISKQAAGALEKLKETRFEANSYFKHYDVSADPASLAKARQLASNAEALEKQLEAFAKFAGKKGLISELREARRDIAKSYDVERALNVATGDVSARVLGRAVDKGKPITGGLATAGKFAEAFPSYAREGATIPTPGVSKLEALSSLGLGMGGYSLGGWPGAAAAALPFMSGPVRSGLLSNAYQNAMMPSYRPALSTSPNNQLLMQLGILNQR